MRIRRTGSIIRSEQSWFEVEGMSLPHLAYHPFLNKVVDALKEGLGHRLEAVVLFGSRARGASRPTSDWDLLIIAHELPPRLYKRHLFLKALLPDSLRAGFAMIAKTPEEFEASLPALYLDIALDGIILYDPHDYAKNRLEDLRALIRRKGLKREKLKGDFVWRWVEFPGFDWSLEWERGQ